MAIQAKQASSKEAQLAVEYVVLRSGKGFTDGLCSGYLTYYDQVAGKQLSDTEVYRILVDAICMPGYADEFNAGYAVGLVEALVEDRDLFALPETKGA